MNEEVYQEVFEDPETWANFVQRDDALLELFELAERYAPQLMEEYGAFVTEEMSNMWATEQDRRYDEMRDAIFGGKVSNDLG